MNESLNESFNYKAICKTAPATPGLVNINKFSLTHIIYDETKQK